MFACCHLAKEGRISLRLNVRRGDSSGLLAPEFEEGELLIAPPAKILAGAGEGVPSNFQFIMAMDMAEYRQKCEKYGITAQPSNRQRTS
eukprot:SAG31_NODE_20164_length_582_cov_0.637681_1_plen_89_part_00